MLPVALSSLLYHLNFRFVYIHRMFRDCAMQQNVTSVATV